MINRNYLNRFFCLVACLLIGSHSFADPAKTPTTAPAATPAAAPSPAATPTATPAAVLATPTPPTTDIKKISLPGSSILHEEDISRFISTIDVIKDRYAKNIDEKKLLEDAIRGMVSNLDPHSEYLDEQAYKALLMSTNGEFGGLGIEVGTEYGVLKVIAPMDDTPASKAGIKAGDYIVALDGKLVQDMTADQAVQIMRGKKGTPITLTVIRKGEKKPLVFKIIRDTIRIISVKSKMLEPGYGYVRISQFQEPTAELLNQNIENLKKAAGGNLKGLIIDLRNNPGGLLNSAIDISDMFLESSQLSTFGKVIVYTDGRVPESQFRATATGRDILKGAPLVVLINEGSASASEIVAGALQDYRRALIVGNTSFGKGSVQTVIPIDQTHAIKLTTALYHTPSGRIIQNQGIIPDIYISTLKLENNKAPDAPLEIREMQLRDHLNNPDNQTLGSQGVKDTELARNDFQLYEALNILKAVTRNNAFTQQNSAQ